MKIHDMKTMELMRKPSADRSGVHVWLVLMKAHRSMVRHAARSIIALEMGISDFAVASIWPNRYKARPIVGPENLLEESL